MRKVFGIRILAIIILLAAPVFIFWRLSTPDPGTQDVRELEELVSEPEEAHSTTSKPLISYSSPPSVLTERGIFNETNRVRNKDRLRSLALSPELSAAAKERARTMLELGYFDHTSPSGEKFSVGVSMTGYEAIFLAENIALGNFKDDRAVVDAWIESPGHRKNVSFSYFQEIGVGTAEGKYQGRHTWIAVQIFGLPKTACPIPRDKDKIEALRSVHDNYLEKLNDIRISSSSSHLTSQERRTLMNEFGYLHAEFQSNLNLLNSKVNAYNSKVLMQRECVEKIFGSYEATK